MPRELIVKRDGREQKFDPNKITQAIARCLDAVDSADDTQAMELTLAVLKKWEQTPHETLSVEAIQDTVEAVLIEQGLVHVAKSYILYREHRSRLREAKSELMDAVSGILKETNRDNANVSNSPSAKVLQIAESASKSYYLGQMLDPVEAEAHNNGDIYIHDLSWYGKTLTCLQIPLDKLLDDGFSNGHGHVRSPKGIKTAAALSAIILQANQNDMHGGQSFGYFDRDMAKYVDMEKERQAKRLAEDLQALNLTGDDIAMDWLVNQRTEEEVYQAMEGFIYNLNTMHSRAGAQVPFSSINIGTDTSWAGRQVTKSLLLAYEKGLGRGETPLFPNICFKLKKGVNFDPKDPNYDLFQLSMKVACKRLFPSFSFQDSSFNSGYGQEEVGYMGCRTRVIANCNGESVTNARGNLSFTTLNLPRLGMRAGKDLASFWELLDEQIAFCFKQLLNRYNVQKKMKVKDFPFLMGQKLYLDSDDLKPEDTIEKAIKHGTLSLGFIGLAECLVALTGQHHGQSEAAQTLGVQIVAHMRKRCDEAMAEHGLNFSLLATPAEQLSGKFVKNDVKAYGKVAGVTDKAWYTNSFHVPVEYTIAALDKIALEGPYHSYCNAGHISYVELPSAPEHNIAAFETLVRAMAEADMGYASVNFPVDICDRCGLNGLIPQDTCPKCGGENISRVRRITGYLSTLDKFNPAKLAEVTNRQVHG